MASNFTPSNQDEQRTIASGSANTATAELAYRSPTITPISATASTVRARAHSHRAGSVRHAEKRRVGTCRFADRIARAALEVYRRVVPDANDDDEGRRRRRRRFTVVAAVVAFRRAENDLRVVGLGAGTKFLPESTLREDAASSDYGRRVRDCHAEVLARRAFVRQLTWEVRCHRQRRGAAAADDDDDDGALPPDYAPILRRRRRSDERSFLFEIRPEVTLHFYTSSVPCGNAALKKFATLTKETFDESLGESEWPDPQHHEPVAFHSIRLGQTALLLKKDASSPSIEVNDGTKDDDDDVNVKDASSVGGRRRRRPRQRPWVSESNDDWCPPGCTVTPNPWRPRTRGSVHTCSDKICRWNCLGWQGAALASVLTKPLFMDTITIGRKMTPCIAKRALCCRLEGEGFGGRRVCEETEEKDNGDSYYGEIKHPTIMGTGVYMDEHGVLDMSGFRVQGNDVRMLSPLCWVWWPSASRDDDDDHDHDHDDTAECVDGDTGWRVAYDVARNRVADAPPRTSRISTASIARAFGAPPSSAEDERDDLTLEGLASWKRTVSPRYETAKDRLLARHKVLRQWCRRRRCWESSDWAPT